MKKSILFALILTVAFSAKAAMIDWQYEITKQSTDTVPGYTAYLISASEWEGMQAEGGVPDQATLANKAMDSATFMLSGSSGKNASKVYNFSTKNSANLAGARALDVNNAASVDAYIVLFDPTANATQATSKMTLTSHDAADGPNSTGVISSTAAAVTGGTWTPVGVPEPTTVALLALGLAALGLKRKVA